jgi:hypothetical protein
VRVNRCAREGDTLPACRILVVAQLDDATRRGVARSIEVSQADMVSAPVQTIERGVSGALELVIETASNKPPGYRRHGVSRCAARPICDGCA